MFLFIAHFSATGDESVFALSSAELWRGSYLCQRGRGGGSTGLSLQVPQRPRKRHAHMLVEGFPIALDWGRATVCKAAASHPPWGDAGEDREGDS